MADLNNENLYCEDEIEGEDQRSNLHLFKNRRKDHPMSIKEYAG